MSMSHEELADSIRQLLAAKDAGKLSTEQIEQLDAMVLELRQLVADALGVPIDDVAK